MYDIVVRAILISKSGLGFVFQTRSITNTLPRRRHDLAQHAVNVADEPEAALQKPADTFQVAG